MPTITLFWCFFTARSVCLAPPPVSHLEPGRLTAAWEWDWCTHADTHMPRIIRRAPLAVWPSVADIIRQFVSGVAANAQRWFQRAVFPHRPPPFTRIVIEITVCHKASSDDEVVFSLRFIWLTASGITQKLPGWFSWNSFVGQRRSKGRKWYIFLTMSGNSWHLSCFFHWDELKIHLSRRVNK